MLGFLSSYRSSVADIIMIRKWGFYRMVSFISHRFLFYGLGKRSVASPWAPCVAEATKQGKTGVACRSKSLNRAAVKGAKGTFAGASAVPTTVAG